MENISYWHVSAYAFTQIKDTRLWNDRLRMFLAFFDVKGTILLSTEGINIALSLHPQGLIALKAWLKSFPLTRSIKLKCTTATQHCFSRLTVKIKPHIIPFPCKSSNEKRYITPEELDNDFDNCMLLDVRNDYEYRVGTFKNAQHLNIRHFTDLPEKLRKTPQAWKKKKVVVFCTGGIRCEKVAPLMDSLGFENVYQLEGGIVEYLRASRNNHWQGECFTFDRRVSLTTRLAQGSHIMCFSCRAPLSPSDQRSLNYKQNQHCPYCAQKLRRTSQPQAPLNARRATS